MQVKRDIDIKNTKKIESLIFTFDMIEYLNTVIYKACCDISNDPNNLTKALLYSWSFIDSVNRARQLIECTPGFKKSSESRVFMQQTEITEQYRNYIQHLKNSLNKKEIDKFPAWGSLSWVDPNDKKKCVIVSYGSVIDGQQFNSCVFDRDTREWVSKTCLSINQLAFNFDVIYDACDRFYKFAKQYIKDRYGDGWGHTNKAVLHYAVIDFSST